MVRPTITADWHLTFVAALLNESAEAADHMELAAARFEENPATRGIANMLRDRANDIRLAKAHDPHAEQRSAAGKARLPPSRR